MSQEKIHPFLKQAQKGWLKDIPLSVIEEMDRILREDETLLEKIAERNPAIPPTVEPLNDSAASRLETHWIEIPSHYRILEVPRSEFEENYERLDENGDVIAPCTSYSGPPIFPAMIRKKSNGKLFRAARFAPANMADAAYLEEI